MRMSNDFVYQCLICARCAYSDETADAQAGLGVYRTDLRDKDHTQLI